MDTITGLLRKLCARNERNVTFRKLELLRDILVNIYDNPDNYKYRSLNALSEKMRLVCQDNEFIDILRQLGFQSTCREFVQRWELDHINARSLALFNDIIGDIEARLPNYQPISEKTKTWNQRKIEHEKYIGKLLADAEIDRLEKLAREQVFIDSLRRRKISIFPTTEQKKS